jgi:adenylate cyclase
MPLLMQSTILDVLKLRTFDYFVDTPEPSGNFTILNITEQDVEDEGGYPFPRKRLAEIHQKIMNNGALGVGWVISFPQADRFGGDAEFAVQLGLSPSVIASFEDGKGLYPKPTGTIIKGDDIGGVVSAGIKSNIPALTDASLEGVAIAPTDVDNLVRRLPLLMRTDSGWVAAFGTQVLKALTGARSYVIVTNSNGVQEISIRGLPPIKTDTYGRKWLSWVNTPTTSLSEMNVQDKFVFVGVTANGVMPQIATPVGLLEPQYIQAALAESMLIENSPMIPEYHMVAEVGIFITTVAFSWLLVHGLGVTWGIAASISLMALTAMSGVYLIGNGLLIDVTYTLISQFIVTSLAFYLRFREQFKLRQQIKKQFEHYLDPRQVAKLQKNPDLLVLGGEKRCATFLFTDVRGFTNMSETLPPEKVTLIMNKALTAQQVAVQKNGGMVDKYIGDAMMAIFNAPLDQDEHETRAVQAALDIKKNMIELNKELLAEDLPKIAIGIGVNTGDAVVGNMGSATRFDYTAIGDAVNTAARLESATKEYGVDLLVGESTASKTNCPLTYLDEINVKGKSKGIRVYTWDSK